MYGKELILDIHECDISLFNRTCLTKFIEELCCLVDMEREDIYFWDYEEDEKQKLPPHLKGTSVVQFIKTSNIVIHSLDDLKTVFLNLFSCKDFNEDRASIFAETWFEGKITNKTVVIRN
jgi:S-adenosylmethionine/arginine decarboxylase-like enzyme